MDEIQMFYAWADPFLIFSYRLIDNPVAGFFLGTLVICGICVVIGELSFRLTLLLSRNFQDQYRRKAVRMHNLSIRAILRKDKSSYTACNTEANEAFGRYFFAQTALGASVLWPAPFALGWMATRFENIGFDLIVAIPGIGNQAGYVGVFILMYILERIVFGRIKDRLPKAWKLNQEEERMVTWSDVETHRGYPQQEYIVKG